MTAFTEPAATLSHLHRADGSASFSQNGYSVIGAVNGPIEVQRRDELPEEAVVDVTVRPAAGVGGTRERHLESIIQITLRQIILVHNFPRTLIQITLQITSTPENENESSKLNQASSNLPMLPILLQTSILSLLAAAVPLATSLTSILLAIKRNNENAIEIIKCPTLSQIQTAESIHVFAFSTNGDLLVAESEGEFDMNDWNEAFDDAKRKCSGTEKGMGIEVIMDNTETDQSGTMAQFIKTTMQEKARADVHWKK